MLLLKPYGGIVLYWVQQSASGNKNAIHFLHKEIDVYQKLLNL